MYQRNVRRVKSNAHSRTQRRLKYLQRAEMLISRVAIGDVSSAGENIVAMRVGDMMELLSSFHCWFWVYILLFCFIVIPESNIKREWSVKCVSTLLFCRCGYHRVLFWKCAIRGVLVVDLIVEALSWINLDLLESRWSLKSSRDDWFCHIDMKFDLNPCELVFLFYSFLVVDLIVAIRK